MVTTPAALTAKLPVKPPEAEAEMLLTLPLSVGAADGVAVVEPPGASETPEYAPNVGGVLAVTLTVKLAVAVKPPSSKTCKTIVFAPGVAPQRATMLAVTLPLALVKPLRIKPGGTLWAETVRLFRAVKSSEIVATGETLPLLPCCRETAAAGVMVGEPLTVKVKFALVVAPQLSVAVTVMVWTPEGAAFVTATTPAALTETLPVKPPDAVAVTLATLPLSEGTTEGVTVAEPPRPAPLLGYAPSVGAALAMTLTVKFAVEVNALPSVTSSTTVFAPMPAAQEAAMSAVTLPFVLTILLTVKPGGTLIAATVRLPAGVASSLTVATGALLALLPC